MKTLITRRNALLTGAGAIAAPFVITAPGFGQTGPIKLSGLVSLTGSGAPFGPNSRMAHQAVVDQVNGAGGLLGRKIEYLAEDDATNPEAGIRGARKLIDVDKVSAIMSVWASAVGTAVLPLCWENKVMMLAISAADSLALPPHQGYFVRTQPHTELQGKEFGRFALRSEEHTSELQSRFDLVCRLLLEKKKTTPSYSDQQKQSPDPNSALPRPPDPLSDRLDPLRRPYYPPHAPARTRTIDANRRKRHRP